MCGGAFIRVIFLFVWGFFCDFWTSYGVQGAVHRVVHRSGLGFVDTQLKLTKKVILIQNAVKCIDYTKRERI